MERFPLELLYLIAILGVILFNLLGVRAARRREAQAPAAPAAAPTTTSTTTSTTAAEETWGRTSAAARTHEAPLPSSAIDAPPAARRGHPLAPLLRDRHALRRAVVLAVVLGPCRANEP